MKRPNIKEYTDKFKYEIDLAKYELQVKDLLNEAIIFLIMLKAENLTQQQLTERDTILNKFKQEQ